MLCKSVKEFTKTELIGLLEEAKNAELCRDLEASQRIFQIFWQNIETNPDVSDFDLETQAELLRLCGFFLSWYGRSHSKLNYQLRGKDLLTNAIEIFERLDCLDKTAEARVMLALCYWYEGEIDECETILQFTEELFKGNELHPVYLQIRLNRLMTVHWKNDFRKAVQMIEEMKVPMALCEDSRLKTMYHNQAGLFYCLLKKYDESVFNHNEAIRFARRIKNSRFIATNLNNLAFVYVQMGDYKSAHQHVEKAISLFENLNDTGWIPHALDTKALLLNEENRHEEALETIEKAVSYFEKSEDYAGLVDALWTKTQTLLWLDRKSNALILFSELNNLAAQKIGEYAVHKYANKFAELIYVTKNLPLTEEVKNYKKQIVTHALQRSGGSVTDAATELRTSHQALSEILHKQFPELREEFGLNTRTKRNTKTNTEKNKAESSRKTKKNDGTKAKKIIPIDLSHLEITLKNIDVTESDEIFTFVAPAQKLTQFAIGNDAIICVVKDDFYPGQPFLICERNSSNYECGIAALDEMTGYFYLTSDNSEPKPFLPDEIFAVGRITGFCLLSDASDQQITFDCLNIEQNKF